MVDHYPIITDLPPPKGLDWPRVLASLKVLEVGQAFMIPAADLSDAEGKWATTTVGSRIHAAARRQGLQIRASKIAGEGLRVKRIA